jgi:hypothetical protein
MPSPSQTLKESNDFQEVPKAAINEINEVGKKEDDNNSYAFCRVYKFEFFIAFKKRPRIRHQIERQFNMNCQFEINHKLLKTYSLAVLH